MRPLDRAAAALDVSEHAARLFGQDPGPLEGVLHVVACWRAGPDALSVMKIGPEAPRSGDDFFSLNLARARAQAIVVTGKILREEPRLRYDLQGPGDLPAGLAAYRRALGLRAPPLLVVLTSGRGLDLGHPALSSWARPVIFTGVEAAARLAGSIRAVGVERPSLRAALGWLAAEGIRGVSIEAGPSTAMGLYDPMAVDELALSVFEGDLPAGVEGGAFLAPSRLAAVMSRAGGGASGAWAFSRWYCREGGEHRTLTDNPQGGEVVPSMSSPQQVTVRL